MAAGISTMEQLEERRLLWALPPGVQGPTQTSKVAQYNAYLEAVYQQEVARSIAIGKAHHIKPSVVGTWKGAVKVELLVVSQKFDLTVAITKVTPTTATGSVTVDGHTFSGKMTGVTKSTEEFDYSIAKGKESLTIAGLLNGLNTGATGTVTAKYGSWKVAGTFSFSKVPVTA